MQEDKQISGKVDLLRTTSLHHILQLNKYLKVNVFIIVLLISNKRFDTVPRGKCWEHLQCVRLHLQQIVKAYMTFYAKVQINGSHMVK